MIKDIRTLLDGFCNVKRCVDPKLLEETVILAIEIAREGREGRKIGTLFVVGDSQEVMNHSQLLILDPLACHPREVKSVHSTDMRETAKELAQLDGAFIIDNEGVFLSACRYLDASAEGIRLPLGLGSRHVAAASITRITKSVAIVVSESSIVRVFDSGELIAEIIPEVWLMSRYMPHFAGPYETAQDDQVAVLSKTE
jgi:DNA integrity scanning protein DisA with diadenylate cyclase activity